MRENRIIGIASILIGLFCIGFIIFYPDEQKLIATWSENIFIRYFIHIMFVNGGIYFVLIGIMFWMGRMIPYFRADKLEKAKHNFLSSLITLPLFVTVAMIILTAGNIKWKIIGIFALSFFLYNLFSSYKFLKEHDRT